MKVYTAGKNQSRKGGTGSEEDSGSSSGAARLDVLMKCADYGWKDKEGGIRGK
jgi:hypothetical protein